MSVWGQYGLQESSNTLIELINYFHDYITLCLLGILSFVTYMFIYVSFNPFQDSYTNESHFLETIWTVIPIFILLSIAFPSLHLLYLIEEISSPRVVVKVIAHQWYWEYQYSNSWFILEFDSYILHSSQKVFYYNLEVDNRLVLPTQSDIMFLISSSDVLHSWTVPRLGIKVDAIPGRLNYLFTMTPLSGVYYGQCREICGANHRFIPIVLEFISIKDFLTFVFHSK